MWPTLNLTIYHQKKDSSNIGIKHYFRDYLIHNKINCSECLKWEGEK